MSLNFIPVVINISRKNPRKARHGFNAVYDKSTKTDGGFDISDSRAVSVSYAPGGKSTEATPYSECVGNGRVVQPFN